MRETRECTWVYVVFLFVLTARRLSSGVRLQRLKTKAVCTALPNRYSCTSYPMIRFI